jgi:hypothetical protein
MEKWKKQENIKQKTEKTENRKQNKNFCFYYPIRKIEIYFKLYKMQYY